MVALIGLLALGACTAQSDLADRSMPKPPTRISTMPPTAPMTLPPSTPSSAPTVASDEQLINAVRGLGKDLPTTSLDDEVGALSDLN